MTTGHTEERKELAPAAREKPEPSSAVLEVAVDNAVAGKRFTQQKLTHYLKN